MLRLCGQEPTIVLLNSTQNHSFRYPKLNLLSPVLYTMPKTNISLAWNHTLIESLHWKCTWFMKLQMLSTILQLYIMWSCNFYTRKYNNIAWMIKKYGNMFLKKEQHWFSNLYKEDHILVHCSACPNGPANGLSTDQATVLLNSELLCQTVRLKGRT